jgi:hypothetical protein
MTYTPKNNVYPLVIPPNCGYPQIVPSRIRRSATWLPWGRRVTPVVSLGGGESESYFRNRAAPINRDQDSDTPHVDDSNQSTSESMFYPRMISDFTKD